MKIATYINGTENGLDSFSGGEGRFAYNLAHALAVNGEEVFAFGSSADANSAPVWGSQKPIENIRLTHYKEIFGQKFDAIINFPTDLCVDGAWTKCSDLDLKADIICHNTFSWGQNVCDHYMNVNKCLGTSLRHLMTMPYPPFSKTSHSSLIGCDKTGTAGEMGTKYIRWLPFPYYDEFSDIDMSNRNQVTWACKDVFTDEWPNDMDIHSYGAMSLEVIKNFANNLDLTVNFITARTFASKRAARFGASKSFADIRKKNCSEYLVPFSQCCNFLNRSRITIIMPNYAGSCFNAIAAGSIAVFANSTPFSMMLCGDDEHLFLAETREKLEALFARIYTDNDFYLSLLKKQREHVKDYSYKNCHNEFLKIYKEFA